MQHSVWEMFANATVIGKSVFIILIFLSIYSIAVMIDKVRSVPQQEQRKKKSRDGL